MAGDPTDKPWVLVTGVEEWRAWLAAHHDSSTGVNLVSWKKHTGRPRLSYEDSVVEALAFGWVDSKAGSFDEDRGALWFSPRKPTSAWSATNKRRIEQLEAEGRLQPAGRAAVAVAKANGRWSMLDEVEQGIVPEDLAAAFEVRPGSREHFDSFPWSVRRGILEWIVQARRAETRERRIEQTAELAERGERANQWQARG